MTLAEELANEWRLRLQTDCSDSSPATQESIVGWLIGKDLERFDSLTPSQLEIARQAMDYRYRILQQRYLGVGPERAYKSLIKRLGSLMLIRNKIRTWVALSRDRQRAVVDVLQEVIQELLQNDRYLQRQISWISECTEDLRLRNTLLLASVEEYCLRPIRNQPLLLFRFVNYLRRSQRGGMTQVPEGDLIRLVSEEVTPDDSESPISLLDNQAILQYQEAQDWEDRQVLRGKVKEEFEVYLQENIGPVAVQWFQLYLKGRSQDAIAQILDMPIKKVYRLREKVSYHANRVFALKCQPDLVTNWLETSLSEHSLGLTPQQWEHYLDSLNTVQAHIVKKLKEGKTFETIAQDLKMKPHQVTSEWIKLYLAAQDLRNAS